MFLMTRNHLEFYSMAKKNKVTYELIKQILFF